MWWYDGSSVRVDWLLCRGGKVSENDQEQREALRSARLFERLGWAVLLLCGVDIVFGFGLLGTMQVFLTTLAATFLVIGIVIRKRASH